MVRFFSRGCGAAVRMAFVAAALAVSGCATTATTNEDGLAFSDPYEDFNRDTHDFNKGADRVILRPIARGYDTVTPGLLQFLIRNALSHLELPRDFANQVLQGEVEKAGTTFLRFGFNTLAGAGGLLDLATPFGLPKEDADFGMTLAKWGLNEGIYYEVPLLGPSTVRDTAGRVVDIAFSPTFYIGNPAVGIAVNAIAITDTRAANFDAIDSVLYESADSYAATRSIYLQRRRRQISGGSAADDQSAPDIFAE